MSGESPNVTSEASQFQMVSKLLRLSARYGTTVLVCGLFVSLSLIICLSLCSMQCDTPSSRHRMAEVLSLQNQILVKKVVETAPQQSVSYFFVVLIMSSPNSHSQRDLLRTTWLSKIPEDVLAKFVIGTARLDPEKVQELEQEQLKHHDLLLLPTLTDSYKNLTMKLLESFIWLNANINYKYVLKTDQDTYVKVHELKTILQKYGSQRVYWGFFDGRAHVKKQGKWLEKNFVLCDRYLPYAVGGGYIISSDLVRYIAQNWRLLQRFHSEDVSVGVWLAPLEINRIHDPRFDTEFVSRGCNNQYLVTHKQSPGDIRDKHNYLMMTGKLCRNQFQKRLSYIYNWNVPPTKCCERNNYTVP